MTGIAVGTAPAGYNVFALGDSYCAGATPCTTDNGNLQRETIGPLNATQTFNYDGWNRLSVAAEGSTWQETFQYDNFGNRWVNTNASATFGLSLSPITPVSQSWYNATTNRLPASLFSYAANGNVTGIGSSTFGYDAENRQTAAGGPGGTAAYGYDGDGHRVLRSAGGVTTTYLYDVLGRLAAEYSTSPPGSLCVTCWVTVDHLGSTRMVTGPWGNVVARHDYLPFGEELSTTNRTSTIGYGIADGVQKLFDSRERYAVKSNAAFEPGSPVVAEEVAGSPAQLRGSLRDEILAIVEEALRGHGVLA